MSIMCDKLLKIKQRDEALIAFILDKHSLDDSLFLGLMSCIFP